MHKNSHKGLLADDIGSYDAGKIASNADGALVFLATRQLDRDGSYLGALSDPMLVRVLPDERLAVQQAE